MALSKKPVTGMKDILPEEMKIRNYVQNVIKDTYKASKINAMLTIDNIIRSPFDCFNNFLLIKNIFNTET